MVKPERVKASLPLRSLLVHAYGRSGLGQHVQASDLTHSTGLGEAMQAAIDSDPEFITLLRMGWKSHWPEPPGVAAGEFHDSRISVSEQHLDDHSELVLAVSLDTELFAALHLSPLGAVDNSRAAASGSRENLSSKVCAPFRRWPVHITPGRRLPESSVACRVLIPPDRPLTMCFLPQATPGWQLLSASLTAGAPAPPIVAFWLRKVRRQPDQKLST